MHILGTGLTGLIGTRLTQLLGKNYSFEYINLENGVNILDKHKVLDMFKTSKAEAVIHMAAKTNVDGCEADKNRDLELLELNTLDQEKAWVTEQTAYAVNVYGTKNIVDACKLTNKKLIYISTDFVFDGTKKHYDENDQPNPLNWYAKTKYEGEKLVQNSGLNYIIARVAYPYRAHFERNDFVRGIISKLNDNQTLAMVTDHIMVPTFIDDFVYAIDVLIHKEENGIFHVVGSQSVTPYEAAIKIAKEFGLNENLINKISRQEYFKDKAQRPFCLRLRNDKIGKLGVEMSSFDIGLSEINKQRKLLNL